MRTISVVVPCYNESDNLKPFFSRIQKIFDDQPEFGWEIIFVDDHSTDGSAAVFKELHERDKRARWIRLAANSGSHLAIRAGLSQARGDAAAVIAADLQDPPEILPAMTLAWAGGSRIVWAARRKRKGEKLSTLLFSRLYHFLMEKIAGTRIPPSGADAMLLDRQAIDRVNAWQDRDTSVLLFLSSLALRESTVAYDKEARHSGRSKWSLIKKWKLFIDSVFMFGSLPVRVFAALAAVFLVLAAGLAAAGSDVFAAAAAVMFLVSAGNMVTAEYLRRILQKTGGGSLWSLEQTGGGSD
jgi:glycosyltransferase involved in cell wall biosynthesis